MLIAGVPPRRQALDALRGVAILLIVAWHYLPQPWSPVHNGVFASIRAVNTLSWSGVDLFFVLSGFLIVGILIDNRAATNYFRTFYIRRFCRIVPLYAVVLVLAAISIGLPSTRRSFLTYLIFQQNALVAFTGDWGPRWLEVTWSLAIEEQFYMIAPLVVRIVRPSRLPVVLVACLIAAPLCRIAMWLLLSSRLAPFAATTLLPCRMDSLALGALIACATRDERGRRLLADRRLLAAVAVASGVVGIAIPLGAGWAWPSVFVSTIGLSFIAIFYGVILVRCLTPSAERLVRLSVLRPLAALGVGAYSIYLFHLTIRDMASAASAARTDMASWIVYAGVLVGMNALVAVVCWQVIERPMIRRGHRYRYQVPPPARTA